MSVKPLTKSLISSSVKEKVIAVQEVYSVESNTMLENNNEFKLALTNAKILKEVESNHELIRLAIINDSDGYTNVRSEPNSKSDILFKLTDEDEFHVVNPSKENSWWIICFENKYGFMHQSRIEIIDGIW